MESNFTSPVHWENEGVEPSTTLKKTGFQGGYKPPASVFNYFFYISAVIPHMPSGNF